MGWPGPLDAGAMAGGGWDGPAPTRSAGRLARTCVVWGFSALAAAPHHPVLVHARTAAPRRGEAGRARRPAKVDSRDAERDTADLRATRVTLGAAPEPALPSPGPEGSDAASLPEGVRWSEGRCWRYGYRAS